MRLRIKTHGMRQRRSGITGTGPLPVFRNSFSPSLCWPAKNRGFFSQNARIFYIKNTLNLMTSNFFLDHKNFFDTSKEFKDLKPLRGSLVSSLDVCKSEIGHCIPTKFYGLPDFSSLKMKVEGQTNYSSCEQVRIESQFFSFPLHIVSNREGHGIICLTISEGKTGCTVGGCVV